jgi:hypothetical protein
MVHHNRAQFCLLQRDGSCQDASQELGVALFFGGHRDRVLSYGSTPSPMASGRTHSLMADSGAVEH